MGHFTYWLPVDASVEEPFIGYPVRLTIPVYGDKASFLTRSYGPEGAGETRAMAPANTLKQLIRHVDSLQAANTVKELAEQLMGFTNLGKSSEHHLVRMGEGVYEFHLGQKNFSDPELAKKIIQLPLGLDVELGYVSTRMDFSGTLTRQTHAYAGYSKAIKGKSLMLALSPYKYKSFSLEKIAWLREVPRVQIDKGNFHHRSIEMEFRKDIGSRNRVYVKLRLVKHGDFLLPLPQLSRQEKYDLPSSRFKRLNEVLRDGYSHIHHAMEENELQESEELKELLLYMDRLVKVNRAS